MPAPSDDFDARLQRARQGNAAGSKASDPLTPDALKGPMSGIGAALRVGTEMVAALVVGVGIGYVLDRWLDTTPWMMVVFFFLGSGAGIVNVYRAVGGIGLAPGYRDPKTSGDAATGDALRSQTNAEATNAEAGKFDAVALDVTASANSEKRG